MRSYHSMGMNSTRLGGSGSGSLSQCRKRQGRSRWCEFECVNKNKCKYFFNLLVPLTTTAARVARCVDLLFFFGLYALFLPFFHFFLVTGEPAIGHGIDHARNLYLFATPHGLSNAMNDKTKSDL